MEMLNELFVEERLAWNIVILYGTKFRGTKIFDTNSYFRQFCQGGKFSTILSAEFLSDKVVDEQVLIGCSTEGRGVRIEEVEILKLE